MMKNSNKTLLSLFIFIFLFIFSSPTFCKEKTVLPQNVQTKITETKASNSSWYLRKASGSKAGKIIYGPFENKEQALLVWIFFNTQANKSTCISRHEAFITKNPEIFYKREFTDIKNQIADYGMDLVFDHLFFKAAYPSSDSKEELILEENYTQPETANPKTTDTEIPDQNKKITEEQLFSEEKSFITEQNESLPVAEETQTKMSEEVLVLKEDVIESIEEPVVVDNAETESIASQPQSDTLNEDLLSLLNKEDTTVNKSNRYTKVYLQDFAPDNIIPIPVDEEEDEEIIMENPDETDDKGVTLLMRACESGNNWAIKNLLKAGADVNLKDSEGWTALMYAVRYQENLSIINTLLVNNANVKEKNIYGLSALMMASTYNDNPQILKKLLSFYSVNEKEVFQAFIMVLNSNSITEQTNLAKISVFLDYSVPVNAFYQGKTPLMYAACFGNSTKVLKLLLDSGAQPQIRSTEGKTAFDYATENKALIHDENFWALNLK